MMREFITFAIKNDVLARYNYRPGGEEVVIPKGVKRIGMYAFWKCTKIKRVVIPEGVTSIGENAFLSCLELEEVVFPKSLRHIERRAFGGCEKLNALILQEGVETIAPEAFLYCDQLKRIVIPETVKEIGASAIRGRDVYSLTFYGVTMTANGLFQCPDELHLVMEMVKTREFRRRAYSELKYLAIVIFYRKTRDEIAERFIKEELLKMFRMFLKKGNTQAIEYLLEEKHL